MRRPGISAGRWPTRPTTSRRIWPGRNSAACATTIAAPSIPSATSSCWPAGHSVPTCYALWMIMGQALERKYQLTGDKRYYVDPHDRDAADRRAGIPPRRGRAEDAAAGNQGLADHPLFAQAKGRGIRALPATPKASTSPMTSTADPRASASPPPPAKPRSGTSSARPTRRRSSRSKASSP